MGSQDAPRPGAAPPRSSVELGLVPATDAAATGEVEGGGQQHGRLVVGHLVRHRARREAGERDGLQRVASLPGHEPVVGEHAHQLVAEPRATRPPVGGAGRSDG